MLSVRTNYNTDEAAYSAERYRFIELMEGSVSRIYTDEYGIPTVGVGHAFQVGMGMDRIAVQKLLGDAFGNSSFALSDAQWTLLSETMVLGAAAKVASDAAQAARNSGNTAEEQRQKDIFIAKRNAAQAKILPTSDNELHGTYIASRDRFGLYFNTNVMEYIFNRDVLTREDKLPSSNLLPLSKERVAILSLLFNGVGVNSIKTLISKTTPTPDQRVAIWYEIRYRSNLRRLATAQRRRDDEADEFGLYSSADGKTPKNALEAQQVIKFLDKKRSDIQTYYNDIHNSLYTLGDLIDSLTAAHLFLNPLALGITVNGKIIVGEGIGHIGEEFADVPEYPLLASADGDLGNLGVSFGNSVFNDNDLVGTENNDLVFLGKGVDTFHGNGGDDVIYAGDDSDTVYGDAGDDFLIGEKGTDYLYGGEGDDTLFGMDGYGTSDNGEADYLEGGKDYDTYITGDGDTINDTDGQGVVSFENIVLTGGTLTGTYGNTKTYEGDGGMYILQSDGTLIFSRNGNYLTITNYHKENNDLGIVLTGDDLELSIFASVVSEDAGTAIGAVTLTHAYSEDVIVTLYTQDDSAIAGSDYFARPTFDVHIAAGETYVTFDISIIDNQEPEPTETFYALVDTVRTLNGESVDFTLIDVQPFTIEEDDLLPVNSLIQSKLQQKAA